MIYPKPNFKPRYQNFIGGQWTEPVDGQYFSNPSPIDGADFCEVARSNEKDIELAVEAAWQAAATWTKTSATERSRVLNKIADRIECLSKRLTIRVLSEWHGCDLDKTC